MPTPLAFHDLHGGRPPWDTGAPQPALLALTKAGELRGRVLDIGCGTGEHTLMAAAAGLDATGIDLAAGAPEAARGRRWSGACPPGSCATTPFGCQAWASPSTPRLTRCCCTPSTLPPGPGT